LDWTAIAETDPYWGVLADERYRGQELAEAERADFYNSGKVLVDVILQEVRSNLDANFAPTRSLDFGCGVGRLLIPLARRTKGEAVGVDVAPKMIEITRRHVEQCGLSNVTLVLGNDELSNVTGDFDLINSFLVFQHIPPPRGYAITAKLLTLLRPGGVACLHYSFARDRRILIHNTGNMAFYRVDGRALHDLSPPPPSSRKLKVGAVHMFDYDLNHLTIMLAVERITRFILKMDDQGGHMCAYIIFKRIS
jgi:SAM-dependent methyltransferase